jgi:hypothetical protein
MNEVTTKNSSSIFIAGGAGFLALAALFLVRDLALPPPTLLAVAALGAAVAAVLRQPRRWRWAAPAALLGLAAVGGAWFAAITSPTLLPALAVTSLGAIVSLVHHERRRDLDPGDLARQLAWYAAGAAFLVASAAFYFHFLTLGIADESLVRRLVPTIGWLAIGLGLSIAAGGPASAPGRVGVGFTAVAVLKALIYDSTHLQGPLRVTVFAAVGVLLLAGARLMGNRERA